MVGQAKANVFEGQMETVPLLFVEKQVVAISIKGAYLTEGDRNAIPFTECEVYAPTEIITPVRAGN
jgi:hypothetical protein